MTYTAKAYYKHGHGDDPVMITTPDDIDALVEALAETALNSVAALHINERPLTGHGDPDHTLRIAVHAPGKVGSVYYSSGTDAWYAAGRESQREEGVLYNYMHNLEGFPQDSEVDLDTVRSLAKGFLSTGGDRPDGVEWIMWPQDQV